MSDLIARIDETMHMNNGLYALLKDCKAEIERLSKPYVPMTDEEFVLLIDKSQVYNIFLGWEWEREVEAATIARYNEQRGVK